jgi:hypothetical protein
MSGRRMGRRMTDKAADSVWFVRGVAVTLRADVAAAAKREGMRIGPWVERALRAAIAGSGIVATDPMADLTRRLQAVEARLAKLERGEAVPVEDGGETVDAPVAMGAGEPSDRQQRRRPWTVEDDTAVRRIAAEGGTQADAMRELQRTSGTINSRWQSLGLPVAPRKGRKFGPRGSRAE